MTNNSEVVVKLPEEGERYWVVGGRYITIKATGAETGGAYGMWEVLKLPGEGVPLHSHIYEDESWYVLEGELEFVIGERTVRAPAGTYLHGPKGIPHSIFNVGSTPARVLVTVFPAGFENFFRDAGELVTDPSSPPPEPDMERRKALRHKYGLTHHESP